MVFRTGRTLVVPTEEMYTSTYHICDARSLIPGMIDRLLNNQSEGNKHPPEVPEVGKLSDVGHAHRSLVCTRCHAVVDRDENATNCIAFQALYAIANNKVPWEKTEWWKKGNDITGNGKGKKRKGQGGGGGSQKRRKASGAGSSRAAGGGTSTRNRKLRLRGDSDGEVGVVDESSLKIRRNVEGSSTRRKIHPPKLFY